MSRLIAFFLVFCMLGVVHAAEVTDAPIPEDNILGILVFLALMVGSGVFFAWKVMRNNEKGKDTQDKK